jgi:hypothetical protein
MRLARRRSQDDVAWREWWAPTGFEPIKGL